MWHLKYSAGTLLGRTDERLTVSGIAAALDIPRRMLIILCSIGMIVFIAETAVTFDLKATGTFTHFDILFDTDPPVRLPALAHGAPSNERLLPQLPNGLHPLFAFTAAPVIRVLGIISMPFSNGHWTQREARETLALFVSPLSSAAAAIILGLALCWLGLPQIIVTAAVVLRSISSSGLIFGALPDHFAMGGLAITCLLAWLAYWLAREQQVSRPGYVAWAALAVFATGITITHAGLAAIVFCLAEARHRSPYAAALRALAAAGVIFVSVIALGVTLGVLRGMALVDTSGVGVGSDPSATYLKTFVSFQPQSILDRSMSFLASLSQSEVLTGIRRVPSLYIVGGPDNLTLPGFSQWTLAATLTGVSLLVWFVMGIRAGLWSTVNISVRYFTVACLLAIASNLLLHSVYGEVPFLYSQHWISPLAFILAIAFCTNGLEQRRNLRAALITGLLAAIAANNFVWLARTIATTKDILADYQRVNGARSEKSADCALSKSPARVPFVPACGKPDAPFLRLSAASLIHGAMSANPDKETIPRNVDKA